MGAARQVVNEFDRTGYTVLRNAFPRNSQVEFLSVIRRMMIAHVATKGHDLGPPPDDLYEFFQTYALALERADHSIIKTIYDICFHNSVARKCFLLPKVLEAAGALLGCDSDMLICSGNRFRFDPPGPAPYRLGWHQEATYGRLKGPPGVQFWGPLLWPSSWENGSVEVAEGSHTFGIYDAPEKPADSAAGWLIPDDFVSRFPIKLVEIEAGDLVMFSCNLIHRSSDPTRQTQMKYSITGRLADAADRMFLAA